MMPPEQWSMQMIDVEGETDPAEAVFDYPRRYGGTMSDEKPQSSAEHDNMLSAPITTGAQAAQQTFEQQEAAREAAQEQAAQQP